MNENYREDAKTKKAVSLLIAAIDQAQRELIYYPDDAATIIREKHAMETALDALSFTWKKED